MSRLGSLGHRAIETEAKRLATYLANPGGVAAHNIFSAMHSDAVTGAAARGALMYGNATPEWAILPVGAAGRVLYSGGTDFGWATLATAGVAPKDAQYLTLAVNATLTNERVLTPGAGLTGADGGAGNTYTLAIGAGDGITVNANDVALTTPGTLTVATGNVAAGNHTHAITTSSNPGAAASILATDGAGLLQVLGLGVGMASAANNLRVGAGANYAQFDADGDLRFTGTADYLVANNDYAFRAVADEDAGLYFNTAVFNSYEFRDLTAAAIFTVRLSGRLDVTGDIYLDDGVGDSPAIQFVGGTNDDTATFGLLDAAIAGRSDLYVQLCDAAGQSQFRIYDSAPALVAYIDSDGLMRLPGMGIGAAPVAGGITMADDAWIGQAAGPLVTFDDTLNYLEITGCNVGIGTTAPPNDLSFGVSSVISTATTDASDNDYLRICGGGAASNTRGAIVLLYGNEHAEPGALEFNMGNVAGAYIAFNDRTGEAARMTQFGKFGLGTTTPDVGLHYASNAPQMSIQDLDGVGAAATPWINFGDSAAHDTLGLIGYGSPANNDFIIVNKQNANIRFYTNADEVVRFHASGGVSMGDGYVATDPGVDNMIIEGTLGIGTASPDRLLHAEVSDAVTNAVTYAQRLTHISSGTVAEGFGVGLEFEAEDGGGTNRIIGEVYFNWSRFGEAVNSQFVVKANYNLNPFEIIVINPGGLVAGNARGDGAVDIQAARGAATQVASAIGATICGGGGNTASSNYASVLGGLTNVASKQFGCTLSSWYAVADKYAQVAHASGRFVVAGDAQGTIQFTARRAVAHSDANWHELFLDGAFAAERMTIATDTVWTFDALITGTTLGCTKSFGFRIEGTIENDGGTMTLLNSTVTTIYDGDDVSFDARASADDPNNALLIEVQDSDGGGDGVRWMATIRTAEVTWPA